MVADAALQKLAAFSPARVPHLVTITAVCAAQQHVPSRVQVVGKMVGAADTSAACILTLVEVTFRIPRRYQLAITVLQNQVVDI